MKQLILFTLILSCFTTATAQDTDDLNMKALIRPADSTTFFRVEGQYVWDNSVIFDEKSGKYHLYYCMWPKEIGYYSWLTHSAIYRAESDSVGSGYRGAELILGRGKRKAWDEVSLFNVKVERLNDTLAMYYCASNLNAIECADFSEELLRSVGATGYSHSLWMPLRNSQRTGVALQDASGEWIRPEEPIIFHNTEGVIANITNNPAITAKPDGGYVMMVKGDHPTLGHKRTIQAVSGGSSLRGDFTIENRPAFDEIATEDATMWYDKGRGRYYAIFHAHGSDFLGLITSLDGRTWSKARHFEVCKKEIPLTDGTIMKIERMERPSILLGADGNPILFSVAVKNGNDSFICFFPLTGNPI